MRTIAVASLLVACASCSQSLFQSFFPNTLASADHAEIPFSSNLPCGGCVRGGYDYCSYEKTCIEKASDDQLCSNIF